MQKLKAHQKGRASFTVFMTCPRAVIYPSRLEDDSLRLRDATRDGLKPKGRFGLLRLSENLAAFKTGGT